LPDGPERTKQELDLQMALGTAVIAVKGYGAPELERAHARAQELCWQLEDLPRLSLVLTRLWTYYYIQGRLQTAHDLTEGLLAQVRDAQEPIPLLELHHLAMGITLLWLGDLAAARLYMERALELHDPQQRDLALSIYACDSHVLSLAHIALLLWTLGYPDQALHRVEAALSEARELNHPFSRAFALIHMARVHYLRREYRAACDYAAAAVALSDEYGLAQYQAAGHMLHGGTRTQPTAADIAELEEGLAYTLNLGREVAPPSFLALLAEVHARLGGHEKSLSVVSEALAAANKTEERWYESELHRLRGELLLAQGDAGEAETSFQTALDMARRQGARSFELRAAVSLARLWRGQGEEAQARELLADIYGWFTEGFDTIDLIEARTLLEELS
jgi:predicted ATPase